MKRRFAQVLWGPFICFVHILLGYLIFGTASSNITIDQHIYLSLISPLMFLVVEFLCEAIVYYIRGDCTISVLSYIWKLPIVLGERRDEKAKKRIAELWELDRVLKEEGVIK